MDGDESLEGLEVEDAEGEHDEGRDGLEESLSVPQAESVGRAVRPRKKRDPAFDANDVLSRLWKSVVRPVLEALNLLVCPKNGVLDVRD